MLRLTTTIKRLEDLILEQESNDVKEELDQ